MQDGGEPDARRDRQVSQFAEASSQAPPLPSRSGFKRPLAGPPGSSWLMDFEELSGNSRPSGLLKRFFWCNLSFLFVLYELPLRSEKYRFALNATHSVIGYSLDGLNSSALFLYIGCCFAMKNAKKNGLTFWLCFWDLKKLF